jgi:hypothetical protein
MLNPSASILMLLLGKYIKGANSMSWFRRIPPIYPASLLDRPRPESQNKQPEKLQPSDKTDPKNKK